MHSNLHRCTLVDNSVSAGVIESVHTLYHVVHSRWGLAKPAVRINCPVARGRWPCFYPLLAIQYACCVAL